MYRLFEDNSLTQVVIGGVTYYYNTKLLHMIMGCVSVINDGLTFDESEITAEEFYKIIGHNVSDMNDRMYIFIDKWINVGDKYYLLNNYYDSLKRKYLQKRANESKLRDIVKAFALLCSYSLKDKSIYGSNNSLSMDIPMANCYIRFNIGTFPNNINMAIYKKQPEDNLAIYSASCYLSKLTFTTFIDILNIAVSYTIKEECDDEACIDVDIYNYLDDMDQIIVDSFPRQIIEFVKTRKFPHTFDQETIEFIKIDKN